MTGRGLAVQQNSRNTAKIDRLGDALQSLDEKKSSGLARLAHVQRPDGLHRRIGQRSDRSSRAWRTGHGAVHLAKNDNPTPRSPLASIRASSPQSTTPSRPLSALRRTPASAMPEMRSA